MSEYPTHSWATVVERFRDLAAAVPSFAPLAAGVAQIAASRFASGLHPVASMHTLLLYQHERRRPDDEQLRLDLEGNELVLRYDPGRLPDRPAALRVQERAWTKRGPDALPLLERALHHLRWFVEYREPEQPGTSVTE